MPCCGRPAGHTKSFLYFWLSRCLLLIKGIAVIPVVFLGWTLYALIVAPVVLLFALLGGLVAFAVQIFLRRGLHEGRP
jgi:hypothetical protein